MNKITLNGKYMKTKEMAHQYIKWKLKTTEYYGENLDALWDALSTYNQPIQISFINTEIFIEKMGEYGDAIIGVFKDAEKENENINLLIHWIQEF